jgi:hypothetical protein
LATLPLLFARNLVRLASLADELENPTAGRSGRLIMEKPSNEQILARALELWEQAGSPDGQEEVFWQLAKRDLQEQSGDSQSAIVPE